MDIGFTGPYINHSLAKRDEQYYCPCFVNKKEDQRKVVSKEEESNEDRIVVEGCVILVDMSGNEALVAVDVVVVIFERESSVGLGKTKVGDVDAAGILLHIDVIVGLD